MISRIKNVLLAIISKNIIFIIVQHLDTDSIFRESIFTTHTITTPMKINFILIDP